MNAGYFAVGRVGYSGQEKQREVGVEDTLQEELPLDELARDSQAGGRRRRRRQSTRRYKQKRQQRRSIRHRRRRQ